MNVRQEGNKLIITLEMEENPSLSASGKTLSLASSKGNQKTGIKWNGQEIVVGVNAYCYPTKRFEGGF